MQPHAKRNFSNFLQLIESISAINHTVTSLGSWKEIDFSLIIRGGIHDERCRTHPRPNNTSASVPCLIRSSRKISTALLNIFWALLSVFPTVDRSSAGAYAIIPSLCLINWIVRCTECMLVADFNMLKLYSLLQTNQARQTISLPQLHNSHTLRSTTQLWNFF